MGRKPTEKEIPQGMKVHKHERRQEMEEHRGRVHRSLCVLCVSGKVRMVSVRAPALVGWGKRARGKCAHAWVCVRACVWKEPGGGLQCVVGCTHGGGVGKRANVHVHVHAACACCMCMLHVHAALDGHRHDPQHLEVTGWDLKHLLKVLLYGRG